MTFPPIPTLWLHDVHPVATTEAIIFEADGSVVARISTLENSTAHKEIHGNVRLMADAPKMAIALGSIMAVCDATLSAPINEQERADVFSKIIGMVVEYARRALGELGATGPEPQGAFALRYVPSGQICDVVAGVCLVTFASLEEAQKRADELNGFHQGKYEAVALTPEIQAANKPQHTPGEGG